MNLEFDGHTVTVAGSGQEALEQIERSTPDVVLLDVMMPDMDGWDVLTRLKAMEGPAAAVPVLMLTARSDDMDRIRGGIEGAVYYITKPFSLRDLRAQVKSAIDGEPEIVKRKRAQHSALEELARIERGSSIPTAATAPRPRLSRLEGSQDRPRATADRRLTSSQVAGLSDKQRALLLAVASNATVRNAALELGVSRSNVYASLRRIARKVGIKSVPELVTVARRGGVPTD